MYKDAPNILLIMTDQHSKHFLGCYGNQLVRTPNLDRLASEGIRFSNAYCPSPLCVPSRMSFMTSRTPSSNRVWNNNHILNSGIPTWAHVMTSAGYETTLLGRMHFCGPDQRHGFEYRPIGEASAGPVGMPWKGGPAWTKFPSSTSGQSREAVEIAGRGHTHYQWSDEERTRAAVQWLRDKARGKPDRPFTAVLGYVLPHCPYVAPKELFDYYYDRVHIPAVEEQQPAAIRRFRMHRGLIDPPLPEERIRTARAAYYGLCEHIDSLIGRVLETLDETGLADNTLVVYTSDHGEMAGDHGCWWKSTYYEGSAGVPLIVRWPEVVRPGTASGTICNLMDIGPTFAEVAWGEYPYPVDGQSLCGVLTGGDDTSRPDETYSELIDHRGGVPLASRMIRSGPWKLWVYADDENLPPVLFNVEDDPAELHDLGEASAYTGILGSLMEKVHEGWNPGEAAASSEEQNRFFRFLYESGQKGDPESPDALVYPSPEYEDDVELM